MMAAAGDELGYGEDPTVSELEREDIEAFLEGPALLM
jgi:hypothetical protein